MLLIIFLALMANSALVSGQCDLGPPKLNNFDWDLFTGPNPWYFLLHSPNNFEGNIDCPRGTFSSPVGNISLVIGTAYVIPAQNTFSFQGNASNWKRTGYFDLIEEFQFWTGTFLVLAVDYNSYSIMKHCPLNYNESAVVYVTFRSPRPDIVTWLRVLLKLLELKIDITKLVQWPTNHCP